MDTFHWERWSGPQGASIKPVEMAQPLQQNLNKVLSVDVVKVNLHSIRFLSIF